MFLLYWQWPIITALTLATAPAVAWQEVIIDCEDWSKAVQLLKSIFFCKCCNVHDVKLIQHSSCYQLHFFAEHNHDPDEVPKILKKENEISC